MRSWRRALLLMVSLVVPGSGWAQQTGSKPAVSNVQVTDIGSTAATVTFSSGVPSFGGVSYQPANGSTTNWTTVNEAYAVNHSVKLQGLKPDTQYNFQAWASGAPNAPIAPFRTTPTTAAQISTQLQAVGQDATAAGGGHFWLVSGVVVLLIVIAGVGAWQWKRLGRRPVPVPMAAGRTAPAASWAVNSSRALPPAAVTPAGQPPYARRLLETSRQGARLAVEVDAELLQRAQACTGVADTAALVAGALEALIYLETSRQPEGGPVYEPEPEGIPRGGLHGS